VLVDPGPLKVYVVQTWKTKQSVSSPTPEEQKGLVHQKLKILSQKRVAVTSWMHVVDIEKALKLIVL
jgi:hypothetical protein